MRFLGSARATALAGLLLAGCGKDGDDAKTPGLAISTQGPASSASSTPTKLLFAAPAAVQEDWHADNLRRLDPAFDAWPSEVLHDRARPVLERFTQALWSTKSDLEPPPDFEGATVLRPEALETLFDDGNLRVQRAGAITGELRPASELDALAKALQSPFGKVEPQRQLWIERIDVDGDGFVTEVRLQTSARIGAGAVQQNLRWRVDWKGAQSKGEPQLRSVTAVSFEEAAAKKLLFADHTARWIGTPEWLERELLHGAGDFVLHQDHLSGDPLLGFEGLAVGDVDGDGLEDLYLCMQGGIPNRLLRHAADGTLTDATNEAKVGLLDTTRSALIVDLDGDGARDIAGAVGPNVWIAFNDGHGVFSDQLVLLGPGTEDVFSISAADPDRDGDLDLYGCRYVQGGLIAGVPRPYHDARNGASNVYWRHLAGRRFENATAEVGFDADNQRFSLAALWEDLDDDGDVDLYVSNDFGRNDLYLNQDGKFREAAGELGADDMAAGMGVTSADFDLDGVLDLYVSNMYSAVGLRLARESERFLGGLHRELHEGYVRHARGNTLLRGLGAGRFEDVTEARGGAAAGWAWGAIAADFDGDGFEDLFVPNGFVTNSGTYDVESFFWRRVVGQSPPDDSDSEPYRRAWASMHRMIESDHASYNGGERDTAFLNLGGRSFADVSSCAGLDFADDSRAVARIDWDNDGRLDLLLKSRTAPRVRFLRNQGAGASFVAFDLVGAGGNRDAIGARVVIEAGGRTQRKSVHAGEGFLAQSSLRVHFGLGGAERVERLEVRWPDGLSSTFRDLEAGRRYRIEQGQVEAALVPARTVETFAAAAPGELAASRSPIRRFALIEKLPLAPLELTLLDGRRIAVSELAGKPVLITLWSARAAGCREQLEAFGRRAPELERAGLRIVALALDQGPELLEARQLVASLGLGWSGYADGKTLGLFEVLFLEALGGAAHVPQPSSLLLDSGGNWVIGYLGPVEVDPLLADLAVLATVDPKSRRPTRLLGGRWALRRDRDWATVSAVYRELGETPLAELFAAQLAPAAEAKPPRAR